MHTKNIEENIKKLGFGLMRLPRKDDEFDLELLRDMIDLYLEKGFSYFDTSPVYGMTRSESIFGELVASRYPRDKFQIATKLPMWTIDTPEEISAKFESSLKALQVDYIDFYMLHGLSSVVSDRFPNSYLDKADRFGAWEFLKQKKAEGKVKHIGFSYHDSAEKLDEILTNHPESEFVQLQINYADWDDDVIQAKKCYEIAQKHGVAVVVTEPCKGGTLVEMRKDVARVPARSIYRLFHFWSALPIHSRNNPKFPTTIYLAKEEKQKCFPSFLNFISFGTSAEMLPVIDLLGAFSVQTDT